MQIWADMGGVLVRQGTKKQTRLVLLCGLERLTPRNGAQRSVNSQLRFRGNASHSERSIAIQMSSWNTPSW